MPPALKATETPWQIDLLHLLTAIRYFPLKGMCAIPVGWESEIISAVNKILDVRNAGEFTGLGGADDQPPPPFYSKIQFTPAPNPSANNLFLNIKRVIPLSYQISLLSCPHLDEDSKPEALKEVLFSAVEETNALYAAFEIQAIKAVKNPPTNQDPVLLALYTRVRELFDKKSTEKTNPEATDSTVEISPQLKELAQHIAQLYFYLGDDAIKKAQKADSILYTYLHSLETPLEALKQLQQEVGASVIINTHRNPGIFNPKTRTTKTRQLFDAFFIAERNRLKQQPVAELLIPAAKTTLRASPYSPT